MEPYLTVNQACSRAQVSRRTIYNWMASEKIQFIRTAGKAPRILASSLFQDGNISVQGTNQNERLSPSENRR